MFFNDRGVSRTDNVWWIMYGGRFTEAMEYLVNGKEMSLMDKLNILTDAAKYDVACTSSGVERQGKVSAIVLPPVFVTAFPVTEDVFPF